jgi:hypothetical protein
MLPNPLMFADFAGVAKQIQTKYEIFVLGYVGMTNH